MRGLTSECRLNRSGSYFRSATLPKARRWATNGPFGNWGPCSTTCSHTEAGYAPSAAGDSHQPLKGLDIQVGFMFEQSSIYGKAMWLWVLDKQGCSLISCSSQCNHLGFSCNYGSRLTIELRVLNQLQWRVVATCDRKARASPSKGGISTRTNSGKYWHVGPPMLAGDPGSKMPPERSSPKDLRKTTRIS